MRYLRLSCGFIAHPSVMTFMDTLLPTPPTLWAVEEGEEPKGEELKGEGVWRETAEDSDHGMETSEEGEVLNCVCVCVCYLHMD